MWSYNNSQIETLYPFNTHHCKKQIKANSTVCINLLVTMGMSRKKGIRVKLELRTRQIEEKSKEKRAREGGNCGTGWERWVSLG